MPYLAILLVIIDELPHEIIWRLWSEHYDIERDSLEQQSIAECVRTDGTSHPIKESGKVINEDHPIIAIAYTGIGAEDIEGKNDSRDKCSDSTDTNRIGDDSAITQNEIKDTKEIKDDKDTDNTLIVQNHDLPTSTSYRDVRFMPVRFFIHAKYPDRVRSKWVRDRLVPFNIRAGWGTVELTEIMIKLLDEVSPLCYLCLPSCNVLSSSHFLLSYPLVMSFLSILVLICSSIFLPRLCSSFPILT